MTQEWFPTPFGWKWKAAASRQMRHCRIQKQKVVPVHRGYQIGGAINWSEFKGKKRLLAVWIRNAGRWVLQKSRRIVAATAGSTTICYILWQYDSALQQSLVTVHSARLAPHGSAELERINNCDPKVRRKKKRKRKRTTLLKLECRASFTATTFNYISKGFGFPLHSPSPTFFHATFDPVLLHSVRTRK